MEGKYILLTGILLVIVGIVILLFLSILFGAIITAVGLVPVIVGAIMLAKK